MNVLGRNETINEEKISNIAETWLFSLLFYAFFFIFVIFLWLTRHMECIQTLPDTITQKGCAIFSKQGLSCPEKYWKSYSKSLVSKTAESAEVRLMRRNGRALRKLQF